MKQETFRRVLTDLTPEVPEALHLRVEAFLQEKLDQEVCMKESTKRALKEGARFSSRTLLIALIAVILLGTAAFAASRWGVFDALRAILGAQPPTADSVMQGDLHRETVNGVEITVREAGYDGRTLFLQYSYRLPERTEPMGTVGRKGERMLSDADFALLADRGVGWWADVFWINGQPMDMALNSGGEYRASEVPGEIVCTEYWRLDNLGVTLSGEVEIALPIGERQNAAFDRASGQYLLPDRGVVTFTFDARDALSRVVQTGPQEPTVIMGTTLRVTETVYTPLMTYVTLSMETAEADPGAWISSLQLVDGGGQPVFPGHSGCNGCSGTWAEFIFPYMDPAALPESLWLAPVSGGAADMACAIRVK